MGIHAIFSKRNQKIPEIFKFDELPKTLANQIIYILSDIFGTSGSRNINYTNYYSIPINTFLREHGLLGLTFCDDFNNRDDNLREYLSSNNDINKKLDLIELLFQLVVTVDNVYELKSLYPTRASEAIKELNYKFRENGIGYCFDGNQIIKLDSTVVYNEITQPTIALLHKSQFKAANEYYMMAQKYYKDRNNKSCITNCGSALESIIKIILEHKKWEYSKTDGATKLIDICFKNKLIPDYLQSKFTSLQALLKSSVPTIRNKASDGHGNTEIQSVDDELVRYTLNLTGSTIIFLVELSKI